MVLVAGVVCEPLWIRSVNPIATVILIRHRSMNLRTARIHTRRINNKFSPAMSTSSICTGQMLTRKPRLQLACGSQVELQAPKKDKHLDYGSLLFPPHAQAKIQNRARYQSLPAQSIMPTVQMDTAGYRPPSNVKPALLVIGLALIYPALLARRIYFEPGGIYALDIKWSLVWFVIYILQLTFYTIPFFITPLNALPRTADEKLLTGALDKLIRRHEGITELTRKVPNNGLIYVRGLLHFTHTVALTSPQALQEVLNTRSYDFEKPRGARRFLTRVLGTGLIVAEGATHRWQRKAVGPAFQQRHIRDLVPLFWAKARQMVDGIASGKAVGSDRMNRDQQAFKGVRVNNRGQKETEVEIGGLASRATLDIIGKAGFGRDFNTVINSEDELAKQYDIILDPQKGKNAKVIMLYMAVRLV